MGTIRIATYQGAPPVRCLQYSHAPSSRMPAMLITKKATAARAAVTNRFCVAVPPIGAVWVTSPMITCQRSSNGISPSTLLTRMK